MKMTVISNFNSEFDFENLKIAKQHCSITQKARVLIRVNPDIDPQVHPYISTGLRESKFGINENKVFKMAERVSKEETLELAGIHCHLGK